MDEPFEGYAPQFSDKHTLGFNQVKRVRQANLGVTNHKIAFLGSTPTTITEELIGVATFETHLKVLSYHAFLIWLQDLGYLAATTT